MIYFIVILICLDLHYGQIFSFSWSQVHHALISRSIRLTDMDRHNLAYFEPDEF